MLAADVAGYSRLMGADEVGTARTLREHRAVTDALVSKHGGRIVKTTGDGVLLEFPSVVDAVECAVAVQAVMAEVIARNTAFTFKGKPVDIKKLGRELNVRYVLEGSVQRGGDRLRVNVQLIDAETGNHLWAERFDKPIADLFDMQDEIVSRLANTLNAQLIEAEARRENTLHPDAVDLYFLGRASVNKGQTLENLTQARSFFERALALDPGNIEALVGMAMIDHLVGVVVRPDDRVTRLAVAEAMLTKVLSLAPNHAWAHCWLGAVQIRTNREAQGIAECERALALDPNLADAHGIIGVAARKPRAMSRRLSASVLAMREPMSG